AATGTLIYQQLKSHLADLKVAASRLAPSTNLAACIQMAVDGLGIACVPSVMASAAIEAGKLQRLDYAWVPDALCFEARFDAETSPLIVREAASIAAEISQSHKTE
ncbi:MAG: LysR substrate-binding domain-containing protein, partial [Pseudomonadota bacterium]